MKKLSLLAMLALLLMVSCRSKEDKALDLIDKELFTTLYDYKSYEPVQTKVDSAFTSIYRDSLIRSKVQENILLGKLSGEYIDNSTEFINSALDYGYGSVECNKAYEKSIANMVKSKNTFELQLSNNEDIYTLASKLKPEFYGWEVYHKYRVKTKGGYSDLSECIYVFDEDMETIVFRYNINDEDEISLIERIKEISSDSTKIFAKEIKKTINTLESLLEKQRNFIK